MINWIKLHPYKSIGLLSWAMISTGNGLKFGLASGLIFGGIALLVLAFFSIIPGPNDY